MDRRRGFTLVELLVVMMMMIALMTIVLPGFQRIRLMAKRAACGSNLRELIKAVNTYSGENNSFLPPRQMAPGDNPTRWWGIDQAARDAGEQPYGELFRYADNPEVFHCPALSSESSQSGAEYDWAFTSREVGYGYNAYFLGWSDGSGANPPAAGGIVPDRQCNVSYFVDSSKTVVFADSAVRTATPSGSFVIWWPNMSWSAGGGGNSYAGPYPRHLKRANLAMLDGGVRPRYEEEMYDGGGNGLRQIFDPRYPRPGID
ncbi:MAG: type II secretion system protein [Planctomycetota bacterium]|jgi:prepilin-type N-terminal cleavage/methylation domain-containing protein/prepilin-type processing-associated H-X9-DG protein